MEYADWLKNTLETLKTYELPAGRTFRELSAEEVQSFSFSCGLVDRPEGEKTKIHFSLHGKGKK